MNYSKNAKIRKKVLLASLWFVIGVVLGLLIGTITEQQPAEESVVAVNAKPIEKVETFTSLGEYELTAYCPCSECCGKADGITASGEKAKQGVTIAADTDILPFGTEVVIDGHTYIVQDVGGAIKGNKIDVYFNTHQDALEFGVQHKEIFMKEGEL